MREYLMLFSLVCGAVGLLLIGEELGYARQIFWAVILSAITIAGISRWIEYRNRRPDCNASNPEFGEKEKLVNFIVGSASILVALILTEIAGIFGYRQEAIRVLVFIVLPVAYFVARRRDSRRIEQ